MNILMARGIFCLFAEQIELLRKLGIRIWRLLLGAGRLRLGELFLQSKSFDRDVLRGCFLSAYVLIRNLGGLRGEYGDFFVFLIERGHLPIMREFQLGFLERYLKEWARTLKGP